MRVSAAVGASTALLLASAVSAFRDSSPMLVWSSTPNDHLRAASDEITSGVIAADSVFGSLASLGCDWDVAMVVHQDELHQSQVETMQLPYKRSAADLHIPYLVRPNRDSLDSSVQTWAQECGAELISEYDNNKEGGRKLVYFNSANGQHVPLPNGLPAKHLVVLTGTRDLSKRQSDFEEETPFASERPSPETAASTVAVVAEADLIAPDHNSTRSNSTLLLDRYQLLSMPIISSFLIVVFILLPILYVGISSLASIQVPQRMLEISKTMAVSAEKKQQ